MVGSVPASPRLPWPPLACHGLPSPATASPRLPWPGLCTSSSCSADGLVHLLVTLTSWLLCGLLLFAHTNLNLGNSLFLNTLKRQLYATSFAGGQEKRWAGERFMTPESPAVEEMEHQRPTTDPGTHPGPSAVLWDPPTSPLLASTFLVPRPHPRSIFDVKSKNTGLQQWPLRCAARVTPPLGPAWGTWLPSTYPNAQAREQSLLYA